jgi:2'-hydroxyisoflavone reductase
MNLLILGGTRFLGRHIVASALERGHAVTLFNRGRTNPHLFPDVETLHGDRERDLAPLSARRWDAVVDVAGYVPRIVGLSAQALAHSVDRYVFISSISAYASLREIGVDESSPLATLTDESVEEITGETYGPLKVLCEKVVQQIYGERALIVRPGLIVGPHDGTDRFTYWPVRVARGGDVLAPDRPDGLTQVIDVRDLSDFTIKLIEEGASGAFNATGPDYELSFGKLLETCKQVSGSDARFHWASPAFMEQHNVAPWSDMPVYLPDSGEDAGFARVSIARALTAGLTFRPLTETVADTLAWAQTRPPEHEWKAGLSTARETELLKFLDKRKEEN